MTVTINRLEPLSFQLYQNQKQKSLLDLVCSSTKAKENKMTFLLSVRTATILSNRLHAVKCQRFTLVPLSTNRQYNNSCTSKSASILSATPAYQPIGQSIRNAHFFKGNKKWQISSTQNSKHYGESVYEGKYTNQMLRVKLLSFTTSMMGAIAQPVLWQKGMEVSGAGLGIALCSIIGVFTFVTPVLLHLVVKKYVIDILHNKETDEYTAITISPFMFRKAVTSNHYESHFHAGTPVTPVQFSTIPDRLHSKWTRSPYRRLKRCLRRSKWDQSRCPFSWTRPASPTYTITNDSWATISRWT